VLEIGTHPILAEARLKISLEFVTKGFNTAECFVEIDVLSLKEFGSNCCVNLVDRPPGTLLLTGACCIIKKRLEL
jgi:hypothetical protein